MELSYKDKTIKYALYCLLLAAAAFLQNVFAVRLAVCGAHCFIAVPLALLIATAENEWAAALLGLFAGCMLDMYSAQQRGYAAIFLMLACYICAALVQYLFRHTFLFCMLVTALVTLIYVLLYWLLFVLLKSSEGAGLVLGHFYVPSYIYTVLTAPLLYLGLQPLQKKLNKTKEQSF